MKATIFDNKKIFVDDYYSFLIVDSANMASRLLSYLESGAVAISASRENYTNEENIIRTKELEKDLNTKHYGFRPSFGGYKEKGSLINKQSEEGELSFVVPKPKNVEDIDFLNDMLELGRKYEQDTILVILPNIFKNPVYIDCKTGDTEMEFEAIKKTEPGDEYYTRLVKGKTPSFTFYNRDSISNKLYRIRCYNNLTLDAVVEYYSNTKLSPNASGLVKNKYEHKYSLNNGALSYDSYSRFKK